MKEKLKNKALLIGGTTSTMVLGVTTFAFAADDPVTTAFTAQASSLGTTIASVAGVGATIMGVFLAWKYGKKIFNKVAN